MQTNAFQYALSMGFALSLAVIASLWLSMGGEGWILLSAFLIALTNREAPLRQGLIVMAIIVLAMLLSVLAHQALPSSDEFFLLIAVLFVCVLLYPVWYVIVFFMVFVLAGENYAENIVDVLSGTVIVLACRHFLFPVKWDETFSNALLPAMKTFSTYANALAQGLFSTDKAYQSLKNQLEQDLQHGYPEWVYAVGFNPGLRKGLRYFLVNLERLAEVHFSIQYVVESSVNPAYLSELKEPLLAVMQKNQALLAVLIHYFEQRRVKEVSPEANYTSDMAKLEEVLQTILPAHMDLLDISPDYLLLTELVRDLKDARDILLQLVMTLQEG